MPRHRKRSSGGAAGVVVLLLAAAGWAQTVIENPARPLAKNAGRVVTPQLVASISDEGTSEFYFGWPHSLAAGPGGSLLLRDRDQVLHFDANGKFLRNLFKKGQGPGEMSWPGAPVSTGKNIVVYAQSPDKLVVFDLAGRYEREIPVRPEGRSGPTLIGYRAGRFIFKWNEFPRVSGEPAIIDNPQTLLAASEADGSITTLQSFVTKAFAVTAGGGGGMFDVTSIIVAPLGQSYLALIHTEDYLIKLFDPVANKVVKEFRRPYARVKGEPLTEAEKKGGIIINGKHYTRPERKFENDIKNLLVRDGEIWAVTSTRDEGDGILVDVFDAEGIYQDSFYLKVPAAVGRSVSTPGLSILDGEFLWVVQYGEDETFSIGKYRVLR